MTDELERRLSMLRAKQADREQAAAQNQRMIERDQRAGERDSRRAVLPLLEEFTASLERHGISSMPIVERRSWKRSPAPGEPWGESFHWVNEHGWLLAENETIGDWDEGSQRYLDMLGVTVDRRVFRPFRLKEVDKVEAPFSVKVRYLFRPLRSLVTDGPLRTGHYDDHRLFDRDHYATMLGWHLDHR